MTEVVHGEVATGFGLVADAFAEVLEMPGEEAAAVAVMMGGRPVVDLWGGVERSTGRPMERDSLLLVASCSKGVTATVLAMLVEQGAIDPDAFVADYWPEYAANGKARTTVAMVASHRAGLPFPPSGSGLEGLDQHRGRAVLDRLADAAPAWEPGTAMAYHAVTYGTLLGEIIRRATGRTVGDHVRALIREPLGADVWIGLPPEQQLRLVPGRWRIDPFSGAKEMPTEPGSYADVRRRALLEAAPIDPDWDDPASVAAVAAAELPAVNAATNARALARMYAATIGEVDGRQLYSEATRRRVTRSLTDGVPALAESGTAGPDIRFGLGYQLASPSMPGFGPASYGHTGAGGRLGIADADLGVAFGFVCSRMGIIGPGGDARWTALIDAVRRAIGVRI